jgi:hypothetical protein
MGSQAPGSLSDGVSTGRAVALLTLAPLARRLAEERERQAEKDEERRQLERELAALPPLQRPDSPGGWFPWWSNGRELKEVLLGLLIVGVPAVAIGTAVAMLIFMLVFGSEAVGVVLGVLCGLGLILAWCKREVFDEIQKGKELSEAEDRYAQEVKEFDAREAEISAIRLKLEKMAQ